MKLIVGLGNPGENYQAARHNIGFILLDQIARTAGVDFEFDKRINAEIGRGKWQNKPVILAKPHTFVNKSGEAVKKLAISYKLKALSLVVVHDDLDIEFGSFKLSLGKDSAGHRGVQSVINALKTNKFWRLRIGTANPKLISIRRQKNLKTKKELVGNFVLSKFTPSEQSELKKIIKKAIERLEQVI